MKIITDTSLWRFEAWSGGRNTLDTLIEKGLCEELESVLEDVYPDGMTDTELNDLLWFDNDTIAEWLGFSDWEDLENDGEEEEEEDEDDNGLPEEANENYDEIAEQIVQYDTFEEFCPCNEAACSPCCADCVLGCLNINNSCKEVFNRFKELEG